MARRRKRSSVDSLLNDSLFTAVIILCLALIFSSWKWKAFIVTILALVAGLYLFYHFRKFKKLRRLGIEIIDEMKGQEFEERLYFLFKDLGYSVQTTSYSGDYGGDLIISKDGIRTVVQAKRYKGSVGLQAVQEAVAAQLKYNCRRSMVVTNSTFTRQARDLAYHNNTELWDRERLLKELERITN